MFPPPATPPYVTVSSVLPSGFAACARVLPPLNVGGTPTRWAALARAVGVEMHSGMRGQDLLNLAAGQPLGTFHPCSLGLDPYVWPVMLEVLLRHTTSESLVFGFWEGHLGKPFRPQEELLQSSIRRWALAQSHRTIADTPIPQWPDMREKNQQSWPTPPCLVWPRDRTWFVHSDIDDMEAYVAGSEEAIQEILACPDLEAVSVEYDDGL